MHGCEGEGEGEGKGEGDGDCGNVVFSNVGGLILALNISDIVWMSGESLQGGVMYSWFSQRLKQSVHLSFLAITSN
jgi:hypothetical protein